MPLNIIPLADGRSALVATSGYNKHELSLVDLVDGGSRTKKPFAKAGSASAPTARSRGLVVRRRRQRRPPFPTWRGNLTRIGPPEPDRRRMTKKELADIKGFRSGLYFDAAAGVLYSLDIDQGLLARHQSRDGTDLKKLTVGGRPYDVVRARNGLLYVSDWAGRQVVVVQPRKRASSPASPSANTRIRSSSIRRTTGCSWPARRATASR